MNDFISLSRDDAATASPVVSQLVSVKLTREEERIYRNSFIPKPTFFIPIGDELAQLSARLNGFMCFLRFVLADSRRIATMDRETQRTVLSREAERIMGNVLTVESVKSSAAVYLENMQQGSPFIITKVKGGYDFNFVGDSIVEPKSCRVAYNEHPIINTSMTKFSESYNYKSEKMEAYSTELSLGAVRAGRHVIETIFGASISDPKNAGVRQIATLPITFDFEQFNDIFFDKTGVALAVNFFKNISPNVLRQFSEVVRISMVRSPNTEFLAVAERASPGYDLSEHVTEEGMALSQILSFAMTMHISDKLAHYICQSEESQKISYAALNTWASMWNRRYMRPRNYRAKEGGRVTRNDMPLFIVPLSKVKKTTDIRRANNYAVEPGKGDENNIYIGGDGGLHYGLPTALRSSVEKNLDDYESTMDDFFEHCYTNGLTASQRDLSPSESFVTGHNREFAEDLSNRRSKVNSFAGKALTFDWDYGISVTVGIEDPTQPVTSRTEGSARVDTLTIADYLGYNFAQPGEMPIQKTFADSMVLMMNLSLPEDQSTSSLIEVSKFAQEGGVTGKLIAFYNTFINSGLVPPVQDLIDRAKGELELTNLEAAPYSQGKMYRSWLSDDFKSMVDVQKNLISLLLQASLQLCSGSAYLREYISKQLETNDSDVIEEEMKESSVYFDARTSPMKDFANVYNTLGGKVFQLACKAITDIPHDKLFVGTHTDKFNYKMLTSIVLPQAIMFAKYVPDAENIFAKAEVEADRNVADENIAAEDIKVPGSAKGMQFFPHQVRTHGALRKRPAFAILDIRPGGGKTMLGLSDIGALIQELDELGETIRPLIICPEKLIVNWVNDEKTLCGTNWNVIPITGNIVKRWGYDRLEKLINEAPRNTICVCGMDFLKAAAENIVIGNLKVKVSNNLELMKRLAFSYILIDESQKIAAKTSTRHKHIKQLTTASNVKYLRLATGTFIHGRVSDAIGQVSLYNGHIFRDGDVLTGCESDVTVGINGQDIPIWKVDTPARARTKLARYSSITTLQKKHWAFLLPSPIETFFAIPLVPHGNDTSATNEDRELGELHRQLYDTVLNESLAKLSELAKNAKNVNTSDDDDDDETESEDGEDDQVDEEAIDLDVDEGELPSGLSAADLEPYLQRLERLITNPMADPLAPSIFGLAGVKQYHSAVARYVATRIDEHFNPPVWSKSELYNEYSLVSYKGKLWLAKKNSESPKFEKLPADSKGVGPDENPDYWREEPQGKVIVFCRYLDSIDGVYNALPEKYKKVAVKYSGREVAKDANLDAFKNDERVQIIVANEAGISEGHNLQLASRIIRVESPWNPGDLDQSSSRIFRPDPAASKAMQETGRKGELYREVVFLDWIVCDGTLHVQKQARLIAKVFNKYRFDEVGNPNYTAILEEFDLPEIPMSLDVLRSRSTLEDYKHYRRAYAALNGAQTKEFHDMRRTQDPSMQDLPQTPLMPGMTRIATPFIPNQRPDDIHGYGLVSLRNVFRDPAVVADLDSIKGLPVVTDLGNGRISKYRVRYKFQVRLDEDNRVVTDEKGKPIKDQVFDKDGNPVVDPMNPVSSVTVKLTSGEMILLSDPGMLFVATKLKKGDEKEFAVRNLDLTEAQERKLLERESREVKRDEKRQIEEQKRLRREQRDAADRKAAAEDGKKRVQNVQRGKPINAGIKRVKDVPSIPNGIQRVKNVPDIGPDVGEVTLHPAYYHGYLTLEVKSDEVDAALMKKLKFRSVPSYAYARATRFSHLDKIVTYLENNFVLSKASADRLLEIEDAFDHGGKELYKMELVNKSTLPLFFATSQKLVTNRKEVKPYPIILPNELQIAIDIAACPAIRKHIGIAIPGAGTKWTQHEGHYMYFAENKNDMKAKIKEAEEKGLVITNKSEALDEIANIKFRAPRSK